MSFIRKLGTPSRYTFIVDNDGLGTSLENCTVHILHNTQCQTSEDNVVNAVCQAHHDKHRSATKTLHTMAQLWFTEMRVLLDKGVPRKAIITAFRQAVQLSVDNLEPVTMTIQDLCTRGSFNHGPMPCGERDVALGTDQLLINSKHKSSNSRNAWEGLSENLSTNCLHPLGCESIGLSDEKVNLIGNRFCGNSVTALENSKKCAEEVSNLLSNNEAEDSKLGHTVPTVSEPIATNETPLPIELKMEVLKESTEFDESDDVGWFFEDGQVPPTPELDDSLINLMSEVMLPESVDTGRVKAPLVKTSGLTCETLGHFTKMIDKSCTMKNGALISTGNSNNCYELDLNHLDLSKTLGVDLKHMSANFVVNKTTVDCPELDEFDSCFDDQAVVTSPSKKGFSNMADSTNFRVYNHSETGTDSNAEELEFDVDGCSSERPQQTTYRSDGFTESRYHNDSHQSDDEFDACFDDGFVENDKFNETTLPKIEANISITKMTKHDIVSNQEECNSNCVREDTNCQNQAQTVSGTNGVTMASSNLPHFEERLQQVLKQKSTRTKHFLGRSRHFRTMDMAIRELQSPIKPGLILDHNCLVDSCSDNLKPFDEKESYFVKGGANHDIGSSLGRQLVVNDTRVFCDVSGHKRSTTEEQCNHHCSNPSKAEGETTSRPSNENLVKTLLATQKNTKSKVSSMKALLNSRHFKTIENTLGALNGNAILSECKSHIVKCKSTKLDCVTEDSTSDINQVIQCGDELATANTAPVKSQEGCDLVDTSQTGRNRRAELSREKVQRLVMGLSHGCVHVINAVCDVIMTQASKHNSVAMELFRLETGLVHTFTRHGRISIDTRQGMVVETSRDKLQMLHARKTRQCLLLNGDVSPTFRHKGYKQEQKVKTISRSLTKDSNCWLERVWNVMQKLNVNGLLIHGRCDNDLEQLCASNGIVVLTQVPFTILQAIAHHDHCAIATYVHLCSQQNRTSNMNIEPLASDWMDRSARDQALKPLAVIHMPTVLVTTTIFSHPVQPMTKLREEEFWHTLYRTRNTFACGRVLIGGGGTEQHCVQFLKHRSDKLEAEVCSSTQASFTPEVYRATAIAFHKYVIALRHNVAVVNNWPENRSCDKQYTECAQLQDHCVERDNTPCSQHYSHSSHTSICNNNTKSCKSHTTSYNSTENVVSIFEARDSFNNCAEEDIFDDFVGKTEAWMSACQLVCQIMQTDMDIITGVQTDAQYTLVL